MDDAIQESDRICQKMGVKMPDVKKADSKKWEEGEKLKDRPTGPTYGEEKSLILQSSPFGKGEERRTTTGRVGMRAECERYPSASGKNFSRLPYRL